MRRLSALVLLTLAAVLTAGCDQLGIESAAALAARREADGKAVGGACRHAARAIEDCYTLNRKADRAAVYAGWREMNEYMLEHKIEPVVPVLSGEIPAAPKATEHADAAEPAAKPAERPAGKPRKQAS
jgi:hypothetical protein